MQDLASFISSTGLATIVSSILTLWFSTRLKASIEHEYNQKLEIHKAQLKSQTETEIERLKAQFAIAAAERQIQYSRVFDETAKVITQTYAKLLALKDAAQDFTQPLGQSDPQRVQFAEVLKKRTQEFLDYFLPRKIYIPKATAERIRVYHNTLHGAAMSFSMAMAAGKAEVRDPNTFGKLFDKSFKASDEAEKLLVLLEDDFQDLLGFKLQQKSNNPNQK